MKTLPLLLIGALAASLCAFAQDAPEAMAYLGVASRPADKAVTEVLGLPEGVGLIIEEVLADSAASKAGLRQHDLLHKFDNQLLISPRQLAVLVRSKKPGDKVGVDYLRKGKAEKVDVTLGSAPFTELPNDNRALGFNFEPPKVEMLFDPKGVEDFQKRLEQQMAEAGKELENARKQMEKQLGRQLGNIGGQLDQAAREMDKEMQRLFQGGGLDDAARELENALGQMLNEENLGNAFGHAFGGVNAKVSSSTVENGMKFTYEQENEKKSFKVEDVKAGKVLFDGPVNTEAERGKVPADHMAKLLLMEKNNRVAGGAGKGNNRQFFFNFGRAGAGQPGKPGRAGRVHPFGADDTDVEPEPKALDGIVSIIEDDITVSISKLDGKAHCKAIDEKGKVLFDGPIATKAEQAKLPDEVRDVLEDMNALPAPGKDILPDIQDEEEL